MNEDEDEDEDEDGDDSDIEEVQDDSNQPAVSR
jgi:hypothetical protein